MFAMPAPEEKLRNRQFLTSVQYSTVQYSTVQYSGGMDYNFKWAAEVLWWLYELL